MIIIRRLMINFYDESDIKMSNYPFLTFLCPLFLIIFFILVFFLCFRFLKFAPHGKIARILNHDDTLLSNEDCQENNSTLDHDSSLEGYSIPEYELETIEKLLKSNI